MFKKIVCSCLMVALMVTLFVSSSEKSTAASGNIYYVSIDGSDTNPGSLAEPFLTIQKCADIASAGATCYIRGGTYRETVVPGFSGTAGEPITFASYEGEKVVVSGADLIPSTWTPHSGTTYKTTPPITNLGLGRNQLFMDGQMMTEAQWPNTSLDISHPNVSRAQAASDTAGTNGLRSGLIQDEELPFQANEINGAMIRFGAGPVWVMQSGTVNGTTSGQLTFDFKLTYGLASGNPYYLIGKLALLDAPSEWVYDSSNSMLYLQTTNQDLPSAHTIEMKQRQYAFNLGGRSYIHVRGLHIFAASIYSDLTTQYCEIDQIEAKYVSHNMVSDQNPWSKGLEDTGLILNGTFNKLQNSKIAK